jgi:hypothetical protein
MGLRPTTIRNGISDILRSFEMMSYGRPCAARRPVPLAGVCGSLLAGLLSGPGLALPPDPQRPFDAMTCKAARIRYHEALTGSPLISANENADVLALAKAQLLQLCGPGASERSLKKPSIRLKTNVFGPQRSVDLCPH